MKFFFEICLWHIQLIFLTGVFPEQWLFKDILINGVEKEWIITNL